MRRSSSPTRTIASPTTPVGPSTSALTQMPGRAGPACKRRASITVRGHRLALAVGAAVATADRPRSVRRLLPARTDVVPLDHLVQCRRLDVKQLGGPLLHAAGGFERRLDQAPLKGSPGVAIGDPPPPPPDPRHPAT